MPAQPVFIEQAPEKTQAQAGPGQQAAAEANGGLPPVERPGIKVDDFYFPGSQAQCLAAMGPKPAVKYKADHDQIERIKNLAVGECLAVIEG